MCTDDLMNTEHSAVALSNLPQHWKAWRWWWWGLSVNLGQGWGQGHTRSFLQPFGHTNSLPCARPMSGVGKTKHIVPGCMNFPVSLDDGLFLMVKFNTMIWGFLPSLGATVMIWASSSVGLLRWPSLPFYCELLMSVYFCPRAWHSPCRVSTQPVSVDWLSEWICLFFFLLGFLGV